MANSRKLVLREVLLVDWRLSELFNDYILDDSDRNYKFKNPKFGTLTYAQLS